MIAFDDNSLCRDAKQYYYDLLFPDSSEPVPDVVTGHVEHCQQCQEQLSTLGSVLSQGGRVEPAYGRADLAVTTMLRLHFGYLGRPVSCEIVKPFLPALSDSLLEMRIPTPITAHLDNCPQCLEDLRSIQRLNLDPKRLYRLSQVLGEKPIERSVVCSRARGAVAAVASLTFSGTNEAVLKHMSSCAACRRAIYKHREKSRTGWSLEREETQERQFPCEGVSAADIFDYVVPYGLDPANDQYAKFRETLTSHVRTCPACLAKMQDLHRTIYDIADRAASGVVTVCSLQEPSGNQVAGRYGEIYHGFPISVEVTKPERLEVAEKVTLTEDLWNTAKHRVGALLRGPSIRLACAVAAAMLLVSVVILNVQTTKAVSLAEICRVFEKGQNIHVSRFVPGSPEPIQELLVSRTLNIYATKTGEQWILWDLPKRLKKTKDVSTGRSESAILTDREVAVVEGKMHGLLGAMPFDQISDAPAGAVWSSSPGDSTESHPEGLEPYDLTWTEKTIGGLTLSCRWRVLIDRNAKLPHETRFYCTPPGGSEYQLEYTCVVNYPSEDEMHTLIASISL